MDLKVRELLLTLVANNFALKRHCKPKIHLKDARTLDHNLVVVLLQSNDDRTLFGLVFSLSLESKD